MKHDVLYLTGATGFVGGMLLRLCETDESVSKVYTPIRYKHGKSGQERFNDGGFSQFSKAKFISDEENIPRDITLIILCAYNVRFQNAVETIVKDSIVPILHILDQCSNLANIRGICLVSTSYVQNPLPYKRSFDNQIPFALRKYLSATELYNRMIQGTLSWEKVKEMYSNDLSDHQMMNCYAFSKHVLEHLIHEKYPNLPLCILRPSIIAPSRDGTYGHGIRAGLTLFIELARSPIIRFPMNKGMLDIVFVDDVGMDILRGASELAQPASLSKSSGENFHPIYLSTSKSELYPKSVCKIMAPNVKRFYIQSEKCRKFLCNIEKLIVKLAYGSRKAKLVQSIYFNYDYVMANTWDFEANHDSIDESYLREFFARFYQLSLP